MFIQLGVVLPILSCVTQATRSMWTAYLGYSSISPITKDIPVGNYNILSTKFGIPLEVIWFNRSLTQQTTKFRPGSHPLQFAVKVENKSATPASSLTWAVDGNILEFGLQSNQFSFMKCPSSTTFPLKSQCLSSRRDCLIFN